MTYLPAEVNVGGITRPRDTASMAKKETVMLPTFSDHEAMAYLRYPMWRKQWMSHIVDYKKKYLAI